MFFFKSCLIKKKKKDKSNLMEQEKTQRTSKVQLNEQMEIVG